MRASQSHKRHAAAASACTVLAVLLVCGVATASASPRAGSGLLSAAAQDTAPGDQRPQRIKAFMQWATSNGVTFAPGLTVQPFEQTGYHVVTTAEVGANATLFTVPVDVAVRVDSKHTDFSTVFASELASGWWSPDQVEPDLLRNLEMVALLLYERFYVPRSFWQPYWDICPPDFDFLPPYFSDDEAELARVASLLDYMMKQFANTREVWRNATLALAYSRPDVFGARSRANDALLRRRIDWAIDADLTRAYGPRFAGDVVAMVPLSDLLNHAPGHRPLGWGEDHAAKADDGLTTVRRVRMYVQHSQQRVPAGSELFASYSRPEHDCNAVHLAHYGFTMPGEGACDCAVMQFTLGADPALWPHREHDIALLHAAGMVDKAGRVTIQPRADVKFDDVARAVLPAFRATVVHKADQPMPQELVQQIRSMVTIDSELRVCRSVVHLVKGVIAAEEAKLAEVWARVMARRGDQGPTVAMRHIRHVSEGGVRVLRRLVSLLAEYWATLLHVPEQG